MIDINEVHDITFAIAAKNKSAFPSPVEWNDYANYANIDLFNYYNQIRKSQLDRSVHGHSTNMPMALKVFVTNEASLTVSSGIATIPADQSSNLQLSALNSTNVKTTVKKIDYSQRENYLNSTIDAPGQNNPLYCELNNTLLVYPTNTPTVYLTYLRTPATVKWAYTLVGNRPAYDINNSVQFEWQPDQKVKVIMRILVYMGISVREEEIVGFAEKEIQTNP